MRDKLRIRRSVVYMLLALGGTVVSAPILASTNAQVPAATRTRAQATADHAASNQPKNRDSRKSVTLKAVTVVASRIAGVTDQALVSPQTNVSPLTLHPETAQNIGLAIAKLPQFAVGTTPSSASRTTGAGGTALDLRGLGGNETLVLLDGRRFIGSDNINSIPSILVKGVQVVTGGASAAWGSGAVAGVVNFQLDNTYNGGEVRLTRGISKRGNGQETKFQFKFGDSFSGGKGHFLIGGSFASNLGIGNYADTTGFTSPFVLPNGKIQSFNHVELDNQAIGGVITSGVLKNMVFNPNGTLRPFNQGSLQSPSSGEQIGGDGYFFIDNNPLITPHRHYNILADVNYNISNNVQLFAVGQFSKFYTNAPFLSASTNDITINVDNAFLPQNIRSIMQQAGETSFTMGRADVDFADPETLLASDKAQQFTIGLKGDIRNTSWNWNAYVSYGKEETPQNIANQINTTTFPLAVNAVVDPATGKPVCAIALTDPATNCVPIDLFGKGAPSAAASHYVTNDSVVTDHETLEVASASLTGAPWSLPAGRVRVATGVDWRQRTDDETVGLADLLGNTTPFVFSPLSGGYNVSEWFGEVDAPIVKDLPAARRLHVDVAARYSRYSTSGTIWSFKGGFNDQIVRGLRFRAAYSQDIRAPNIGELFSPQSLEVNVVTNPFTGTQNFVNQLNGGNPDLNAEKAHTITAGFIATPRGIPGFTASFSYYRINVENEISSPDIQFVVNDCFAGSTSACNLVTFGSGKAIKSVVTTDENFASEKNSGVDLDFSYVRPAELFGESGFLHARLMGTYLYRFESTNDGVTDNLISTFSGGGIPRWTGFGEAGFKSKQFSVFGTLRFLGSWDIDNQEVIVNNKVSPKLYLTLGGDVALDRSGDLRLGLSVNNVTNVTPNDQTTNIYYLSPMPRYYMATLTAKF